MKLVYLDTQNFSWLEGRIAKRSELEKQVKTFGRNFTFCLSDVHLIETANIITTENTQRRLEAIARLPNLRFANFSPNNIFRYELWKKFGNKKGALSAPNFSDPILETSKTHFLQSKTFEKRKRLRALAPLVKEEENFLENLRIQNEVLKTRPFEELPTKEEVEKAIGKAAGKDSKTLSFHLSMLKKLGPRKFCFRDAFTAPDKFEIEFYLGEELLKLKRTPQRLPAYLEFARNLGVRRLKMEYFPATCINLFFLRQQSKIGSPVKPGNRWDNNHLVYLPFVHLFFADGATKNNFEQFSKKLEFLKPLNRKLRVGQDFTKELVKG